MRTIEISVPDCALRSQAKKLRKLAKEFPRVPVIERAILFSTDLIEAGAAIYAYRWRYGFWPDLDAVQYRKWVMDGLKVAQTRWTTIEGRVTKYKLREDIADAVQIQQRLTTSVSGSNGGYIDGPSDAARRDRAKLAREEGRGAPIVRMIQPKKKNYTRFIDCRTFYGEQV